MLKDSGPLIVLAKSKKLENSGPLIVLAKQKISEKFGSFNLIVLAKC